jgi:hypothetical protein
MKKWLKMALCRIGWHSFYIGFEPIGHNGCNQYARCRWCHKEGMIDSQGNLF